MTEQTIPAMTNEMLLALAEGQEKLRAENAALRAQVEAAIRNARQGLCAQHSSGGHDHDLFAARCDLARSMLTALQPPAEPVRDGAS